MTISDYLRHAAGEHPEQVKRLHESSQRRVKAFGIAIHIPVVLWMVTGYLISSRVFHLAPEASVAVAAFCALLIYLVERLVLATPKAWFVNLGRVLIGVVIAILGASAVDLVVFDREVTLQLRAAGEVRITKEYDSAMQVQRGEVERRKTDWLRAQEAAACEANGTCGSRVRNVGPVYPSSPDRLLACGRTTTQRWPSSKSSRPNAPMPFMSGALHPEPWRRQACCRGWRLCTPTP
jgi:hypothetical protein